ncbi:MAG TPA: monovalent cation/H+ antiporter complex subunit F [Candidatus Methylomirabilis sp.]|nr:monovalent cation/H+ antiporter complex subunit F [Candidatus Methylomirabilis sp.]
MSLVLAVVLKICLAALLLSGLLCLYRMLLGPTTADRAVAFDALAMIFIGIICVLCVQWGSVLYFDAVWILMLVGFLGSASIAKFLEKGRIF